MLMKSLVSLGSLFKVYCSLSTWQPEAARIEISLETFQVYNTVAIVWPVFANSVPFVYNKVTFLA